LDHDGFELSDGTEFTDGLAIAGPDDGTSAVDSDDHYEEGWLSAGFWSYWLSDDGVDWSFSGTGMSGRALTDGAWDGWSWAPSFNSEAPSEPIAAVPEPAAVMLFGLGIILAARRR
jgi:hypothetical protein